MRAPGLRLIRRAERDERGAMFVLAAAGIVLAMIASALAIDLGFIAEEARNNQKIADLAALDGARALAAGTAASVATTSAQRNKPSLTASQIDVKCAMSTAGTFVACLPGHTAIKVTITTTHHNKLPFVSGTQDVKRSAVSAIRGLAGFSLGSGVANISSTKSTLLNSMLGQMVTQAAGGNLNFSVANYQGLAVGTVSLQAIQTQLLAMGLNVGTPNQLLNADLTLAQLYRATGNALATPPADTANAQLFCAASVAGAPAGCLGTSVAAKATYAGTFKLKNLLTVASGYEPAAVQTKFNLLQLLTGSAEIVNGSHPVQVPAISLGVLGAGNATGSLTLIEAPKMYFGPSGLITDPPHIRTAQVDLTINSSLLGLGLLALHTLGGQADGWLTSAMCTSSPHRTTVHAVAKATTTTATLAGINLPITANAPGGVSNPDLIFDYPLHVNPPNASQQSVGGSSLGISVGGLNVLVGNALTAIDNVVVQPLLDALGLTVGTADVMGLDPLLCTTPALFK